MEENLPRRHYASEQYLLPADNIETARLHLQHRIITKAFEDRLILAPVVFKSGDHVLETATGSGIWALEFFAKNSNNDIILNMECIDISNKQFPKDKDKDLLPPNIHFSVNSVLALPPHWKNTFAYVHQRLLIVAMNESRWPLAIEQLFSVLKPGGWLELVEVEAKVFEWGVGPYSKKLVSLIHLLYAEKGVIGDLGAYLPDLLEKAGFSEVHCETRNVTIRQSIGDGLDRSQQWHDLWMGMKEPVLAGHGYGIVQTAEEYDILLRGCLMEWQNSQDARTTYYTITARKPDDV